MKLSHSKVLYLLRQRAKECGSQQNLAKEIGITGQYLSDILNGRRELTSTVLIHLGIRKEISYIKVQP